MCMHIIYILYGALDISRQTGRLPVRFFVEQIQDGYSIIFTGKVTKIYLHGH